MAEAAVSFLLEKLKEAEMAEAAVSFLLENLTQVLKYKVELVKGVEDEVYKLRDDLSLFKSFLKDTSEMRKTTNTLADLVIQLKDVVDKAEDAIDTFILHEAQYQSKGTMRRLLGSTMHASSTGDLAEEIRKIRREKEANYQWRQFGLTVQNERLRKLPVKEELGDVVGFDKEAEKVIKRLMEGPEDLEVTTIVGMAGLGKTTLANKIYNHPYIEYEFFTRAWVQVSEQYSVKDIFLSVYSKITQEQPNENLRNMQADGIAEEIRKTLGQGKYFIVLDDVWETEAWDNIKAAFPNTKKGSRILITSRHQVVGQCANHNAEPHNLKWLTIEESLELLRRKVFGKKEIPSYLEGYGHNIVADCKGFPLAIVFTAGILIRNPKAKYWWDMVSRAVSTRIIPADMDNNIKEGRDLIGWSYDNLPYCLKPCLLYFGVFPENYEIPVWELIRLWIAEGFIEQQGESSLEETAEESLQELVNRNLVMVAKRRSDGRIKTCHVHDRLFEFCKAKAKTENFYLIIKGSMVGSLESRRRICIHSDVKAFISGGKQLRGEHVRSFLSFEPGMRPLDRSQVSTIPKAFKLLRVLDLRPLIFTLFPKEFVELVLLRYIAISSNFKVLPSYMSKLWNIQTIIIETTERKLEIKKDLWELEELRHLIITNASIDLHSPPSGSGGKTKGWDNVQTLSSISPESCTENILSKVPYTKKFCVFGRLSKLLELEGEYPLFNNIGKLQYLTNLKLFNDVISRSPLSKLPPDHMFPPQLTKLTLSETRLGWESMFILAKLEKLEKLKLKDKAFVGEVWEPKAGGFRSLQVLNIGSTNLEKWKVETHYCFPILKRLVLQQCEDLQEVPLKLAELSSFQELEIISTSKEAAISAKKIQELKKNKDGQGVLKLSIFPPDLIPN